jgi:hypothetical protein
VPPARLLPVPRLRPFPCPPGHLPARSCLANGTGYPIAYRFNLDIVQQNADGFHWLHVLAPHGIQALAFTADLTLWSLGILLAVYLFWMPNYREPPASQSWPVVPSDVAT